MACFSMEGKEEDVGRNSQQDVDKKKKAGDLSMGNEGVGVSCLNRAPPTPPGIGLLRSQGRVASLQWLCALQVKARPPGVLIAGVAA